MLEWIKNLFRTQFTEYKGIKYKVYPPDPDCIEPKLKVGVRQRYRVNFFEVMIIPSIGLEHPNNYEPATVMELHSGRVKVDWDNGNSCVILPKELNYKLI